MIQKTIFIIHNLYGLVLKRFFLSFLCFAVTSGDCTGSLFACKLTWHAISCIANSTLANLEAKSDSDDCPACCMLCLLLDIIF
mmetsp:Transcript_29620/g.40698  ORF Transcript_29620/g.40698 Transcript_29620/m.40698 type:complete len:83 (-) Transcript_29620:712-960(-)